MSDKTCEIELKFPLYNGLELTTFLNTHGKLVAADVFQRDTYFMPPHRNFIEPTFPFEWLRMRESTKGAFITYKHFYPENAERHDYCDEFETAIDNAEAMKNILLRLNFKETVIVEKTRSSWLLKNIEVAIDTVKDIGAYIELEATDSFEDPKKGKEHLRSILRELPVQVGEEDLRGYPMAMLKKKMTA